MNIIIPENYFYLFESVGERCVLPSKTVIFYESDDANDICLLIKGRVRAYLSSSQGKQITLEVLKKGRIFGDGSFLNHSVRKANMATITDAEFIRCHITDLMPILQKNNDLMILMLQHLTSTCNYLTHTIERLVNYNSTQKVADFLLIETDDGRKSIPYTHEDIAGCLDMNRVTVSRIMKKLKEENAVEYEYGIVSVTDAKILKHILEHSE